MSQITDEIVALEKRFWTDANDRAYFAERFADDGITVLSTGFVDKETASAWSPTSRGKTLRWPMSWSMS